MAANVDIPKRRSLRLLEEKGVSETPGDRTLRPRTRLSGDRSLTQSVTGSGRRVSREQKKQTPASSKKPGAKPGDGLSVVRGASRRAQGSGEDPEAGHKRRSQEASHVNGEFTRAKRSSHDVDAPSSSMGTRGVAPERPGQSPGTKGLRHLDPGPSSVTIALDHEGPGPCNATTDIDQERPGPPNVTIDIDHGGSGPSNATTDIDHGGSGLSNAITDEERPGPCNATTDIDQERPGPSNATIDIDHGGSGPSNAITDEERPGPSNATIDIDHGGSGPSNVTIELVIKRPGPSKLTTGTDFVGPSPVTAGIDPGGPRPDVLTDHREPRSNVVIQGTDLKAPGLPTGHEEPASTVIIPGAAHKKPDPSSPRKETHDARGSRTAVASVGMEANDCAEAGPSDVRERSFTVKDIKNMDTSRCKSGPFSPKQCEKTQASGLSPAGSARGPVLSRDCKVQCCSKQLLQEVLEMCSEISKEVLESQRHLSQERLQLEHRNLVWDFETAFQENVSINGQSWHEAQDTESEPDLKILEDQFDDVIVETAMKRKRYPKKILSHVVRGLKVEREILDQYKPVVIPEEIKLDSSYESSMTNLTAVTASVSQQISETMKALPVQLEKAQGFSQVLSLQPVLQGSRIRQDIFSSRVVLEDLAKTFPKVLETTPRDTDSQNKAASSLPLKRRRSSPIQKNLYPLRSKRKISLDA